MYGVIRPLLTLTYIHCISCLSIMTGRVESSHLDRRVSDRCDVCGPDGSGSSWSSPSWGNHRGVEESPEWESNLWPRVSAFHVFCCDCKSSFSIAIYSLLKIPTPIYKLERSVCLCMCLSITFDCSTHNSQTTHLTGLKCANPGICHAIPV